MKKAFTIIIITTTLTLLLTLLASCGGGRPSEKYAGYITDGTYYIRCYMDILVNGEIQKTEFEAAARGGDIAERSGADSARLGMVKGGESWLVDYGTRTATRYSRALRPEIFGIFDFGGLTYADKGSAADAEPPYTYDEYTTDAGRNVRFCFDGGALVGLQLLSGGEVVAAVSVLALTDEVPDYMFDVPADFAVAEGE